MSGSGEQAAAGKVQIFVDPVGLTGAEPVADVGGPACAWNADAVRTSKGVRTPPTLTRTWPSISSWMTAGRHPNAPPEGSDDHAQSTTQRVTVVYDDEATSEMAIGDAVEAAAYLDGVRDAVCTIVGDETTWPICNDQGEGGAASCDNLAEVIVRVFDSRFFARRQHAEHGKELDALAIQYEFRFDQAEGTVTWTEGDHTYTVAVRVEDAPYRPYFTADWPL